MNLQNKYAPNLSKNSVVYFCLLTLDEVDEEDGEHVEREPEQVEQRQRHESRVGVQDVVLVNLEQMLRF
jgi:hypothetical protein